MGVVARELRKAMQRVSGQSWPQNPLITIGLTHDILNLGMSDEELFGTCQLFARKVLATFHPDVKGNEPQVVERQRRYAQAYELVSDHSRFLEALREFKEQRGDERAEFNRLQEISQEHARQITQLRTSLHAAEQRAKAAEFSRSSVTRTFVEYLQISNMRIVQVGQDESGRWLQRRVTTCTLPECKGLRVLEFGFDPRAGKELGGRIVQTRSFLNSESGELDIPGFKRGDGSALRKLRLLLQEHERLPWEMWLRVRVVELEQGTFVDSERGRLARHRLMGSLVSEEKDFPAEVEMKMEISSRIVVSQEALLLYLQPIICRHAFVVYDPIRRPNLRGAWADSQYRNLRLRLQKKEAYAMLDWLVLDILT